MTFTENDKSSNVTSIHGEGETAPARRPNPVAAFNFAADDDSGPELNIVGVRKKTAAPIEALPGVGPVVNS